MGRYGGLDGKRVQPWPLSIEELPLPLPALCIYERALSMHPANTEARHHTVIGSMLFQCWLGALNRQADGA